jgi:hypothetical protein
LHVSLWEDQAYPEGFTNKTFEFFIWHLSHFSIFGFSYWVVGNFFEMSFSLLFHITCVSMLSVLHQFQWISPSLLLSGVWRQ